MMTDIQRKAYNPVGDVDRVYGKKPPLLLLCLSYQLPSQVPAAEAETEAQAEAEAGAGGTLAEAGLSGRQEALFLEQDAAALEALAAAREVRVGDARGEQSRRARRAERGVGPWWCGRRTP